MIHGKEISYRYDDYEDIKPALTDVNIEISQGEFVAILGANGCGKSTLVRHLNALLELQTGELTVAGINVRDEKLLWKLRRLCGLLFQNPDNQFVSNVVAEDIAFGLRNYNTPQEEIQTRTDEALKMVGMQGYEKRAPHTLSGGQKQRIALAGVLAVAPDIIVFDEATSMLDPAGRFEILECMKQLHKKGKTILMITHYVEETLSADKIMLLQDGKVRAVGTPEEILTDTKLLRDASIEIPMTVRMYEDLLQEGISLSHCPLTQEELVEELCRLR